MFKRVKKSLFLKQFLIYMTVLLLSFVCLGLVLTNAFKLYFMNQRERQLIQQAERISEQYAISLYTGIIDRVKINRELMILEDNLGASAMLVARNGRVLFVSGGIDADWIGAYVDEASLKKAINGETVVTESISGKTSDYALTVVYPLEADGMVFAALIMNVLLPDVKEQLQNVYLAIFAALAFCGVSSFIALYFSVKRITKPLIEINDAAKVIAGGDFHKKITAPLTDEVGQLAESFNDMAESLNRLEQSKRQFITNISHDIRSPLTSILGFVTAMQDGTAPTESFPKYLGIVRSEVERIIRLSNDIVDLNTLEEEFNKTVIQPFDINRLIRKCAEKFETAAKDKNLELELVFLEETAVVMGDSGKIERVLINLIDNAIKFTENGKISVMSDKDKNGLAVISVRDTGIGLSDTEAKRVFDRFYKVDKARSGTGSGLGLSIVKELLRANGSEISVSSANGEGTSFSFILPLAAACE